MAHVTYLGRYSLADQSAQPYTFGSTGKYVIALVFIPSVFAFFRRILQRRRNMKASDFFVWCAASTPVRQN